MVVADSSACDTWAAACNRLDAWGTFPSNENVLALDHKEEQRSLLPATNLKRAGGVQV